MSLDQTQKDKIATALAQLDHSNPEHWADDGLPRTSVVQQLANDQSIRRVDINETAPGFARVVPGAGTGGLDTDPPEEIQTGSKVVSAENGTEESGAPTVKETGLISAIDDSADTSREGLRRRVVAAEQAVAENEKAIQRLQANHVQLHKALRQARQDEVTRYPRVSEAQMIQDHLRSEHQKRVDAAQARGGVAPQNGAMPADFGRGHGKRVGSAVPYARGPNGLLVRPMSRLEIARQGGVRGGTVPSMGVGAVPQR